MAEVKGETCEISNDMEKGTNNRDAIKEVEKALFSDCKFDGIELKQLLEKFKNEKKYIVFNFLKKAEPQLDVDMGLDLKDIIIKAIKIDYNYSFKLMSSYKNEPWCKDIFYILIDEVTKKNNGNLDYLFESIIDFKTSTWAKDVMLKSIEKHNGDLNKLFYSTQYFKNELWAEDVISKAIDKGGNSTLYILLGGVERIRDKPWYKKIILKCIEIFNTNLESNSLGAIHESLKEGDKKYLLIGAIINKLHEESDEIRFMIISKFDEKDLYKLIIEGRSEVFTSTYNGVINRLLPKLKSNGKDIYDLAESNNFKGINTFIEASVSYGRLDELFNTIGDIEKKKKLIDNMFDENKNTGLNNYVGIIEIINAFKDETLLRHIGEKVKENFDKGKNKNAWGIIGKYCADKFPNDEFFKNIDDKFKLPGMKQVENKDLLNEKLENIQQYYFYNDDDGKSSYDNFISNYKGKPNWKIEDKKSFITIKSTIKDGKSIIIYANKPENDGNDSKNSNGVEAIKMELNGQEPKVVVHRGHSYHTNDTIRNITDKNLMVFLGSCGGFQNIEKVLEKSGNAQIISTKGTGVKLVNDTLFKIINEQILAGKDIIWEDIWKEMEPKLGNNKDFQNYVRPDKNLGAMFYKKFTELEGNS